MLRIHKMKKLIIAIIYVLCVLGTIYLADSVLGACAGILLITVFLIYLQSKR
jgi:hypothetical protein